MFDKSTGGMAREARAKMAREGVSLWLNSPLLREEVLGGTLSPRLVLRLGSRNPGPPPAAPHWPMSEITDFDGRPPSGTTVLHHRDIVWSSSADELRTPMPGLQASRPPWRAPVLSLAVSLVIGLSGCAGPNRISVSGNVDDELVVVQAPQLEIPQPDLDAGFAPASGETPGQEAANDPSAATSSPVNARTTLGSWNRVATVEVVEGDEVQAGQILVRLDSEALHANVSVARANAKVTASQVPVFNSGIDKTYDKEHDVNSALKKINKAIRQLKSSRTTLAAQLSQAQRQLPQLEAQRAQVQSQRQQARDKLRQVNQQLDELKSVVARCLPCARPHQHRRRRRRRRTGNNSLPKSRSCDRPGANSRTV